jgi:hypothetical protein
MLECPRRLLYAARRYERNARERRTGDVCGAATAAPHRSRERTGNRDPSEKQDVTELAFSTLLQHMRLTPDEARRYHALVEE